jgi:hypothetical protein
MRAEARPTFSPTEKMGFPSDTDDTGSVAPRPPRIGAQSRTCPACGWLLPQKPYPETCSKCARRPAAPGARSLEPLSTTERLFLAAFLLRDLLEGEPVTDGIVSGPAWERVMVGAMVTRLRPGHSMPVVSDATLPAVPQIDPLSADLLPLGTSPLVVREYVRQCAAIWRARSCPL